MSENGVWTNLGEQIRDSVTEALNTGDFSGLNSLVSETVNVALQEAKNQAAREKERQQERVQSQYREWQSIREEQERQEKEQREAWQRERERREKEQREALQREKERRRQEQQRRQQELRNQSIRDAREKQAARTSRQVLRDMRTLVKNRRVGGVSGVLYTVFGAVGLGGASIGFVFSFLYSLLGGGGFFWPAFWLVLFLIFLFLINLGTWQRARLSRSERYMQLCGYKMYAMIEDLAQQMGKSVRYVRRDLRRMLRLGFFPEGHMDEEESCFMLNDTVYRQYMQTASAYKQAREDAKRLEEAAGAPKSLAEQVAEEQRAREAELNAIVAEGMEYIRKLRDLNDNIPGEPISGQLFQLEGLLKEIFDRVQEHPEQMNRMHKLMDYYLPTTLKLVEAYEEFGRVSVPGADILSAKAEIEKTLGIINQAFKELLNELFQDAALDVTTDAQVLQTMLAREGLTREMEPLAQRAASGLGDDLQGG